MDINISEANQFIGLHAHPQGLNSNDLKLISDWISKYPYCQTLHILATTVFNQDSTDQDHLVKAATFTSNREVLFQFINNISSFDTESIVLDESLNATQEIVEVIEPKNDMGQAFGADLNYYKVDEVVAEEPEIAVVDEEIQIEEPEDSDDTIEDITVVEEEVQTEELIQETENVEEVVTEESDEEIAVAEDEVQTEEPIQETENLDEVVADESDEESAVAEEETQTEEPIQEIENVEEVVADESVEEVSIVEEETQTEELTQEDENVGEAVAEESVEEIAFAEEEVQTEEPVQETENIEEIVAEERDEEIAAAEEEVQTEEPVQEIENIEGTVAEESVEETAFAEEEVQTEEPVQETENIEEIVAEERDEEIAAAEEETQTEELVQETENIEETVAEESVEEIAVAEEEVQTEEPIQETENVEEAAADESDEEIAVAEEEVQTEEPIQETETEESIQKVENTEEIANEEKTENRSSEKDELIFESPVASDFFAFAKAEKPASITGTASLPEKAAEEKQQTSTKEDVSQYNDETLPYTFLWWLNKTRKEHAINTQPYVRSTNPASIKKENSADQSLNHQIAENIFHLRGVDEIASTKPENQTVPFDFRKKEFNIINKFIKEEPQIKPPAANKIDSENKAKKSSEDANQVVSETLAKIYVEQMLYHKALDVYKKLSLKYPEKSTYFASQIKYLELKVN